MAKKRKLKYSGFRLIFISLIIAGVLFVSHAIVRLFQTNTDEIVVLSSDDDGLAAQSSSNADAKVEQGEVEAQDETVDPNADVLELTAADLTSGPLILVNDTYGFNGRQNLTDFSTITDTNVKPRDTGMQFESEMSEALCSLFDAYNTANGTVNLQIYSIFQSDLDATSIYSNSLADRSTGYGFDIGLITSTGEVVPYIQKCNEWMMSNCWDYGFIVRYPSEKTTETGTTYSPHHFRYVGKVHSMYMNRNSLCLEEYLEILKDFTADTNGLKTSDGTEDYTIYYVPAESDGTTQVQIPKDTEFTVSGNNMDGYILTIKGSASITAAEPEEDETSEETESSDYSE